MTLGVISRVQKCYQNCSSGSQSRDISIFNDFPTVSENALRSLATALGHQNISKFNDFSDFPKMISKSIGRKGTVRDEKHA